MKRGLLNPIYIEQYGFTYVNPGDMINLKMFYSSRDTTNELTIDSDKMLLVGTNGDIYKLKYAKRETFKPFYFRSTYGVNDKDVIRKIYLEREHFGVSIKDDYDWLNAILRNSQPTLQPTPIRRKVGNFGGGSWFDAAAGYWWGTMSSGTSDDDLY